MNMFSSNSKAPSPSAQQHLTTDQSMLKSPITDSWKLNKAPRPSLAGRIQSFANVTLPINKRQNELLPSALTEKPFDYFDKDSEEMVHGRVNPAAIVETLHQKVI